MPVDWTLIDSLDKEEMARQVVSLIEAPADFNTNLWHFAHGMSHFALVMGVLAAFLYGTVASADYFDRKS
jgi:hypothetical protein